jgi:hypothetical protein
MYILLKTNCLFFQLKRQLQQTEDGKGLGPMGAEPAQMLQKAEKLTEI